MNYGATVNHGATRGLEIVPEEERADLAAAFAAASAEDEPLDSMRDAGASTYYSGAAARALPRDAGAFCRAGLDEGALGIGLATQYYPGADPPGDLRGLPLRRREAGHDPHPRPPPCRIDAMQEVLANAVGTGAPLHIVHVNSMALGEIDTVLGLIGGARARWASTCRRRPTPTRPVRTSLESSIFDEGWQERLGIDYGDLQWEETGERLTKETFDRYRREGGTVILHFMKEEWIDTALCQRLGHRRVRRHAVCARGAPADGGHLLADPGALRA